MSVQCSPDDQISQVAHVAKRTDSLKGEAAGDLIWLL